METLAVFLREGGIFMYFILAVSVAGIAVAAERMRYIVFRYSVDSELLWRRVSKSLEAGEVEKARSFLKDSTAPLSRIMDAAVRNCGKSEREIQNAIDEVSLEVMPEIDKRLPYLAMLANIATLLGLLGTIQGLIQAFQAVGSADPTQKATLLASGISIALYTTAFGLAVAIPLLIVYSLLQSRAHRLVDEIDAFSVKLMNLLVHKWSERRTHAP